LPGLALLERPDFLEQSIARCSDCVYLHLTLARAFSANLPKASFVSNSQVSKHLAVDHDVAFCQTIDHAAVAKTMGPGSSVDTGDPETTEVTLRFLRSR
jgi:hypothetical protein